VVASGATFVIGVALLMAGVITGLWAMGIVGFLIMLGAATVGLTALRGRPLTGRPSAARSAHPSHGFTVFDGGRSGRNQRSARYSGSFMQKVEARWRRRRDGGFGW